MIKDEINKWDIYVVIKRFKCKINKQTHKSLSTIKYAHSNDRMKI